MKRIICTCLCILSFVSLYPQNHVIHVSASYESTVLNPVITYSGDYSGEESAPFDIGPYPAPYTVTFQSPGSIEHSNGHYGFYYWIINGEDFHSAGGTVQVTVNQGEEITVVAHYFYCEDCVVTLSGTVSDSDGNPVQGGTVSLSSSITAATDALGHYELTFETSYCTGGPACDWMISVEAPGYKSTERIAPVSCNNRVYNFTLEPEDTPPTPVPGIDYGDVNEDGSIDIVDALLTAQYYVGFDPAFFTREKGDVNCDGIVDIIDALLIAQCYVGLITLPAC